MQEEFRQPSMSAEMPEVKNDLEDVDKEKQTLVPGEACKYPAIAARLNELEPDRIDIQHAVKESARSMSIPTIEYVLKLQRIGRHLFGRLRMVTDFP